MAASGVGPILGPAGNVIDGLGIATSRAFRLALSVDDGFLDGRGSAGGCKGVGCFG